MTLVQGIALFILAVAIFCMSEPGRYVLCSNKALQNWTQETLKGHGLETFIVPSMVFFQAICQKTRSQTGKQETENDRIAVNDLIVPRMAQINVDEDQVDRAKRVLNMHANDWSEKIVTDTTTGVTMENLKLYTNLLLDQLNITEQGDRITIHFMFEQIQVSRTKEYKVENFSFNNDKDFSTMFIRFAVVRNENEEFSVAYVAYYLKFKVAPQIVQGWLWGFSTKDVKLDINDITALKVAYCKYQAFLYLKSDGALPR